MIHTSMVPTHAEAGENAECPDRRLAALTFCPASAAMRVLKGRWKAAIVFHLLDGPLHFAAIRRHLPGVSHQMLTAHLRELESDALVLREATGPPPAPVYYSLTRRGEDLRDVVLALEAWGTRWAEPQSRSAQAAD